MSKELELLPIDSFKTHINVVLPDRVGQPFRVFHTVLGGLVVR